jgi:hypothetical protein
MRAAVAHPLLFVFGVAFLARLVVIVAVRVHWGGMLFEDDTTYERMAAAHASGTFDSWSPYYHDLYERIGALLVPVASLYSAFGREPVLGQLYVALAGSVAAVLVARLAFEIMPRSSAVAAGLIVASLPSQVFWSALIMKDALVWVVLAGLAVLVALALRSTGRRLVILGAGVAALLVMLGFLRLQTLEIAATAVVISGIFGISSSRIPRVLGALALWLFIPLVFGMGVAGTSYLHSDVGSLEARRELNATGADTAVVAAAAPEDEVAVTSGPSNSVRGSIRYLPQGVSVVLLRPYPWEASIAQSTGLKLARGETLLWYPILLLALVGLWTVRRRWRVLVFPVLVGAATLAMYALTEGNLGTAYRHRGEAVWVIALLAGAGVGTIARRVAARWCDRVPGRSSRRANVSVPSADS